MVARSGGGGRDPEFDPAELPPPSNIEVEQALLGAILVSNAAYDRVAGVLRKDHFFEPLHALIYEIAGQMISAQKPVTPGTIRTFLPADFDVAGMTIPQYLARLAANAATLVNAEDFARIIVDLAHRRALIQIGESLSIDAKVTDRRVTIGPVVEQAAQAIFEIGAEIAEIDKRTKTVQADVFDVVADAERRLTDGGRGSRGVSTGLLSLDNKIGGLVETDLVLLAARPSMGKTCVGLNIARAVASQGDGVVFDSHEMDSHQLNSRMLADMCERMGHRVEYTAIDRRLIRPGDVAMLRAARDRIADLPLIFFETGNRIDELPGKIKDARKRLERSGKKLRLYVIDYLGLIRGTDRYKGDKVREVGEISAFLKTLAKAENLPFLVLHQLSRASESRKDKRPLLSDLRDSGNLEQDADAVIFVHREAYYTERPGYADMTAEARDMQVAALANEMELIVAKSRHGPVGEVYVYCDMASNAVRDKAREGR